MEFLTLYIKILITLVGIISVGGGIIFSLSYGIIKLFGDKIGVIIISVIILLGLVASITNKELENRHIPAKKVNHQISYMDYRA